MITPNYENKRIKSTRTSVLEITKGWYLAKQRKNWEGWFFDDNDFTTNRLEITSNLSEAMHFVFKSKKDDYYKFAKKIEKNFVDCKFVKVNIDIKD